MSTPLKSLVKKILLFILRLISIDSRINRNKINNNISLNRDLREYSLNYLYSNLIKNDLIKYFTKPIYNSTELTTKRPLKQAAKQARLALRNCI